MSGGRKRAPGASVRQRMWTNSTAGRLAARRATEESVVARRAAPKCGAKRKGDGRPCQMLALENGRCRLHGGLTPRGDQWHRVQYPGAKAPPEKLEKKLREVERRRRRQAARVAAMPPEERATYEARSHALRPRSPTVRAQERQAREAAKILRSARPAAESEEHAALRASIEQLNAEKARIEAQLAANDDAATEYEKNTHDR